MIEYHYRVIAHSGQPAGGRRDGVAPGRQREGSGKAAGRQRAGSGQAAGWQWRRRRDCVAPNGSCLSCLRARRPPPPHLTAAGRRLGGAQRSRSGQGRQRACSWPSAAAGQRRAMPVVPRRSPLAKACRAAEPAARGPAAARISARGSTSRGKRAADLPPPAGRVRRRRGTPSPRESPFTAPGLCQPTRRWFFIG